MNIYSNIKQVIVNSIHSNLDIVKRKDIDDICDIIIEYMDYLIYEPMYIDLTIKNNIIDNIQNIPYCMYPYIDKKYYTKRKEYIVYGDNFSSNFNKIKNNKNYIIKYCIDKNNLVIENYIKNIEHIIFNEEEEEEKIETYDLILSDSIVKNNNTVCLQFLTNRHIADPQNLPSNLLYFKTEVYPILEKYPKKIFFLSLSLDINSLSIINEEDIENYVIPENINFLMLSLSYYGCGSNKKRILEKKVKEKKGLIKKIIEKKYYTYIRIPHYLYDILFEDEELDIKIGILEIYNYVYNNDDIKHNKIKKHKNIGKISYNYIDNFTALYKKSGININNSEHFSQLLNEKYNEDIDTIIINTYVDNKYMIIEKYECIGSFNNNFIFMNENYMNIYIYNKI